MYALVMVVLLTKGYGTTPMPSVINSIEGFETKTQCIASGNAMEKNTAGKGKGKGNTNRTYLHTYCVKVR